jgi:hypothetical protein
MRVRADDNVVAQHGAVTGAPADECVLHDDAALAELDRAVTLGGEDRSERTRQSSPTTTSPDTTAVGAT